jgi:hypothetical protein
MVQEQSEEAAGGACPEGAMSEASADQAAQPIAVDQMAPSPVVVEVAHLRPTWCS